MTKLYSGQGNLNDANDNDTAAAESNPYISGDTKMVIHAPNLYFIIFHSIMQAWVFFPLHLK